MYGKIDFLSKSITYFIFLDLCFFKNYENNNSPSKVNWILNLFYIYHSAIPYREGVKYVNLKIVWKNDEKLGKMWKFQRYFFNWKNGAQKCQLLLRNLILIYIARERFISKVVLSSSIGWTLEEDGLFSFSIQYGN